MAWGRFFAEQGGSGQGFGTFLVCCRFFVFGCNARYMTHGGDARQDGTSFNGETRAFWRDKRRRRGIWGFGGWGLVAATDGGNREKQQRTATTHGGASPPGHNSDSERHPPTVAAAGTTTNTTTASAGSLSAVAPAKADAGGWYGNANGYFAASGPSVRNGEAGRPSAL